MFIYDFEKFCANRKFFENYTIEFWKFYTIEY